MSKIVFIARTLLLGLGLQSHVALAAVLAVTVLGHEDTGSTALSMALLAKTGNLAISTNLVILENRQRDLSALMLDLLGGGVGLLLLFLGTTAQTKDQVQRRLLLDVVVAQSAALFQLLARKYQTLLIGRNSYK